MPRSISCLPLALGAILCAGCSAGLHGGNNVLKFRHADHQAVAAAPSAGEYVVAFRQHGTDELWQAPDTRRALRRGDDIGFARGEDGSLIAIAGSRQKTLGEFPIIAQYACWYRLPNGYDASRRLRKALRQTAATAGAATLIGTASLAAGSIVSSLEDHAVDPRPGTSDWFLRGSRLPLRPTR